MSSSSSSPRIAGLRRADPLAAELEDGAVGEDPVVHPPADPVARLEHDAGRTGTGELPSGGQPGEARPDDHDVDPSRHELRSPGTGRPKATASRGRSREAGPATTTSSIVASGS